jgi:teichuronic acid biosynthesis glycosyltransferase TuaG
MASRKSPHPGLVSIIIPTWNRATVLDKAIESCLSQTYQNLEVIICDDGSTDGTAELCKAYSDTRITYLRLPHSGGPAKPRNAGIEHASGDWIAFLDSDDEWYSEKIELQLHELQKSSALAACSNAHVNHQSNSYFSRPSSVLTQRGLLKDNLVICSSVIVRKSVLEQTDLFNPDKTFKVGEDYLLWLQVSSLTDILYMEKPLLLYRRSSDGISFSNQNFHKTKLKIIEELLLRSKFKFSSWDLVLGVYLKNLLKSFWYH